MIKKTTGQGDMSRGNDNIRKGWRRDKEGDGVRKKIG